MAAAGFDCEFTGPSPHYIQTQCPICILILREPYQAICCGKSFCKTCINTVKTGRKPCPTCGKRGREFNLYPNKGLQQSLYDFQVYCTHRSQGCEWTGELRELDSHLNSDPPAEKSLYGCPYAVIKCPLSCANGCDGICRKDLQIHVNGKLFSHIELQNSLIKSLEEGQEALKLQVDSLQKIIDSTFVSMQPLVFPVFTMTDFQKHKSNSDSWYSPPVYTHPTGYKICLQVIANGCGIGKGTHLSVFVHLMRGDFDDQLRWPLRGAVNIQLLNQEEENHHVIRTLGFSEGVAASKVVTGNIAPTGSGLRCFYPHSDLKPKYLKNDCIKLAFKTIELD